MSPSRDMKQKKRKSEMAEEEREYKIKVKWLTGSPPDYERKMYDGGKVIAGIIIGAILLGLPVWYTMGNPGKAPDPKIDTPVIQKVAEKERKCVQSKPYMRAQHMKLLDDWRFGAIREADRLYTGPDGKEYVVSLQNTCMNCHSNKTKFCDECHNYLGVSPYCWDCHVPPKEEEPQTGGV
jgi:hypothetical protein